MKRKNKNMIIVNSVEDIVVKLLGRRKLSKKESKLLAEEFDKLINGETIAIK